MDLVDSFYPRIDYGVYIYCSLNHLHLTESSVQACVLHSSSQRFCEVDIGVECVH